MNYCHALVVDDDAFSRQILSEFMQDMRFNVTEAKSAHQALASIQMEKFDIVISDLVMPTLDGLQLLEEIKKIDSETPFLMVTGYPSVSGSVEALKQGASGYITKPFTPEKLQRSINQAFERKFLSDPLRMVKGSIVGFSLSVIMWMLIVLAVWASV